MFTFAGSAKKSLVLAVVMALMLSPARGFAGDDTASTNTSNTKAEIMGGTRTITNTYNPFGILTSTTQITTQTTKTTSSTTDKDGKVRDTSSYTTQTTKVTSEWIGGGLKTTIVEGSSYTGGKDATGTAADGSRSKTDFKSAYNYDANGRLCGVSGGIEITDDNGNKMMVSSVTTGDRGTDAKGNSLGTFVAYSVDTYEIRDGQALKVRTDSVQYAYGAPDQYDSDGKATSNNGVSKTTSTVTYEYELMGGNWVMSSTYETTDTLTTSGDQKGSTSHQEKETIYHRNADGTLVTTKTGDSYDAIEVIMHESVDVTIQNGATEGTTWKLTNYKYTVSFDEQQGYYISTDSMTQDIDKDAKNEGGSSLKSKIIQDVLDDESANEIRDIIKAIQKNLAA